MSQLILQWLSWRKRAIFEVYLNLFTFKNWLLLSLYIKKKYDRSITALELSSVLSNNKNMSCCTFLFDILTFIFIFFWILALFSSSYLEWSGCIPRGHCMFYWTVTPTWINVRENRRGNQNWTIQRNWQ